MPKPTSNLFSDQQFHPAGAHDCRTLSVPLAGGAVLQVDQTAPAHQIVFRNFRERCQDTSLDRGFRLCSRRNHQKTAQSQGQPLLAPTDFEPDRFRNNTLGSIA